MSDIVYMYDLDTGSLVVVLGVVPLGVDGLDVLGVLLGVDAFDFMEDL